MANFKMFCDKCGSTLFKLQRSAEYSNSKVECICSRCNKHMATIDDYNVNWITEEEDTDDSNPTA